ncbi:MAG: hypothetical protein H7X99_09725 [Saprospiraceae bacterium]|nr:hypothetical protein [Saprospiraceae bacterium]
MKPVIIDDATQRLQDIIDATEYEFNHEIKITAGEAKRIDLIRRMKSDTDKQEYMIMLNALMIALVVASVLHYLWFSTVFVLVVFGISLLFYLFLRQKLKTATINLIAHKSNFDKYLWEGYYLKEMRYNAVKLAYIIFFPMIVVCFADIISGKDGSISLWVNMLIAFIISTFGWLIFFGDDQRILDSIESDLKSLLYL